MSRGEGESEGKRGGAFMGSRSGVNCDSYYLTPGRAVSLVFFTSVVRGFVVFPLFTFRLALFFLIFICVRYLLLKTGAETGKDRIRKEDTRRERDKEKERRKDTVRERKRVRQKKSKKQTNKQKTEDEKRDANEKKETKQASKQARETQ